MNCPLCSREMYERIVAWVSNSGYECLDPDYECRECCLTLSLPGGTRGLSFSYEGDNYRAPHIIHRWHQMKAFW